MKPFVRINEAIITNSITVDDIYKVPAEQYIVILPHGGLEKQLKPDKDSYKDYTTTGMCVNLKIAGAFCMIFNYEQLAECLNKYGYDICSEVYSVIDPAEQIGTIQDLVDFALQVGEKPNFKLLVDRSKVMKRVNDIKKYCKMHIKEAIINNNITINDTLYKYSPSDLNQLIDDIITEIQILKQQNVQVYDLGCIDTYNITDLSGFYVNLYTKFQQTAGYPINKPIDVSKWNVSRVKYMNSTFFGYNRNFLGDLSKWNTSSCISFKNMFANCKVLSSIGDISGWTISKRNTDDVIDLSCMFANCTALTSLGDLSKWDTSKVDKITGIFQYCANLQNIGDISKWETGNIIAMTLAFKFCKKLKGVGNLNKWGAKQKLQCADAFEDSSLTPPVWY